MTQGGGTINTSHIRHIAGRALDVLLPPQCPSCNAAVESPGVLCGACWQQIDFLTDPQCSACGLPFEFDIDPDTGSGPTDAVLCGACVREHPPFQRARAVMVYGDFSRKIVLALKHGDRTDTAPALGRWLARAGRALIDDADMIAPVPLHWTRLLARRYNQSALLAGVVGEVSSVTVVQDLLVRKKRTPSQGRMGWSKRRRNVQGAFKVNPARRQGLAGRHVLLIDDVLTTGATAQACAKTLLRGGAQAVDVLTLARVVRAAV
ncbi:MAG TPA: ComF family protein [Rhodospirillales bacterium]|jgi:ComF family protein|nr:ComF family protein [Rhodospirillales bacterium]